MNRDKNLVFVGVPTRDGSMCQETDALFRHLENAEIGGRRFLTYRGIGGGIGRARNILTALALESGAGEMLLMDADVNAGPAQVERILSHDDPVVFGLYPAKKLVWPTRWVVNWLNGVSGSNVRPDGLREALECGAGFVRVSLAAIEQVIADGHALPYTPDDAEFADRLFFDLWAEGVVTNEWAPGKTYARKLTEDFYFCHLLRQSGFRIWVDTVCQVGHMGGADFLAIAQLIQRARGLPPALPQG